ncbi:MAG: glycerophosphodiester phosphodiesterase [Ruminococcaceae bacterium]|nr:glycerophosphodiester phosphodiesterase [Oscillospiraceae bacterium]
MDIVFWILLPILSLIFLLALLYLLLFIRPHKKKDADPALLCDYAHRGLHTDTVPENSLAAFERAATAGTGIELDVQLSSDGVVMVFHDATLIRMTGVDKRLCELTADELSALTLGESEERIPRFCEVLSLINGRVPLLVELKGENFDTSLCAKVAELLKDYNGTYCIESFNPLLIKEMRRCLPTSLYGLLYTNVCRDKKKKSVLNILLTVMAFNFLARPDFIAFNKEDRDSLPVRLTTSLYRAPKFVWTVNTKEELAAARAFGEHPIFEGFDPEG